MKRLFDLVMGVILLILLVLPMLLTAIAVRLTSKGPALYWSDRVGLGNMIFKMPKFRSMRVDTPAVATHLITDPNTFLTPIGGFLRRSSLDELPQLFSVLKGDMSLVGPRPLLPEYLPLYSPRQARRHEVPPGVTGWAQVNGRNALSWEEKFELDVWYVDNQNLSLDIRILLCSFKKVLARDGTSGSDVATMTPFKGIE